jgi:hypothetical protein
MLTPDIRSTLVNALRPPDGYRATDLIACTYTLDLRALLQPPLAFSLADHHAELRRGNGAPTESIPLLLHSLREHAEHMIVFHQAGSIKPFSGETRLLGYLEGSVIAVNAPDPSGLFHPKLWVIRFAPNSDSSEKDARVLYRVLVPSRNITFDSAWDLLVSLEGEFQAHRSNSVKASKPLADFVARLPELACVSLPKARLARVMQIADELRRVEFDRHDDWTALEFAAHGLGGSSPILKERADSMLVVAPFADANLLEALFDGHQFPATLVTRDPILRELGPSLFEKYPSLQPMILKDGAVPEEFEAEAAEATRPQLRDLHAKAFVFNQGWDAKVWLGSANATGAAFHRNVEFMVGLSGKKSRLGVEKWLDGLSGITQPAEKPRELDNSAAESRSRERLLQRAVAALSSLDWLCVVSDHPDQSDAKLHSLEVRVTAPAGATGRATLTLAKERLADLSVHNPSARLRPISVGERWWTPLGLENWPTTVSLPALTTTALTSFFVLEVSIDGDVSLATIVNCRLEGAPVDRQAHLLATLLSDRQTLLRFLHALLSFDCGELADLLGATPAQGETTIASSSAEAPLLESMLRALARQPERCREFVALIKELDQTELGRQIVGEDLRNLCSHLFDALAVVSPASEATR